MSVKKMTKVALLEVNETSQRQKRNKVRKSLQILQLPSDELKQTREAMVYPDDKNSSKQKQSKPSQKAIVAEKENAPTVRRSKRKPAVPEVSSSIKPADKSKIEKSNAKSLKAKSSKPTSKSKKGGRSTSKKSEPKDLNQTTLNFLPVPVISTVINDASDNIFESGELERKILTTSLNSDTTVDSGFDPGVGSSQQNTPNYSEIKSPVKHSVTEYNDESFFLTVDSPPLSYWRDLAEQRRLALEKSLHENEMLHDQLTVLETENAQLKQLVKEAEELASVIKGIIQ